MKLFVSNWATFPCLLLFVATNLVECVLIEYSDTTGTVRSPNFPNDYLNNQDMEYQIEVTSGLRINAEFTSFDINGKYPNCEHDWLEVFLGCDFTSSIGKLCSSEKPFKIYTLSHCLGLKFHSDASGTGKGFQLNYATEKNTTTVSIGGEACKNISSSSSSALIYSPEWPKDYPQDYKCTYTITPPKDHLVLLFIHNFELENNPFCDSSADLITIKGGSSVDTTLDKATLITNLCQGANFPRDKPVIVNKYYPKLFLDVTMDGDKNVGTFLLGYVAYNNVPSTVGPPTAGAKACKSVTVFLGFLASFAIAKYWL